MFFHHLIFVGSHAVVPELELQTSGISLAVCWTLLPKPSELEISIALADQAKVSMRQ